MNSNGNKLIKILAVIAVIIGLVVVAWVWGRPAYRHHKENHFAIQAQVFFDSGDFRNSLLSVRQTLLLNSNNVQACRIMANLGDTAHSPITLDWWRRVVALSPEASNQLALATAGLHYQSPPFPLTTQILNDLSPTASALPAFHVVSAELALALHHMADAQAHFADACRLDPTNQFYQLNYAVVCLASTNSAVAADARAKLKQFCNDQNLGASALRSLVTDCLIHNDLSGALAYSTQLLASPQAAISDQLEQLGILKRQQSPELTKQLSAVQKTAATNATMAVPVAAWMQANGFLPEAISWLSRLPANVQTQPSVRLTLAGCYLDRNDWPGLRDYASKGSWGETDFLRLAFLSRAWNELGETSVSDSDWNSAVTMANNQFGPLMALLELAGRWQLPRAQEDLLLRISQRFPDETWAQLDLERRYLASGNTKGLYQLYSQKLLRSPQNLEFKNNLAFTALLQKINLKQAFQWAADDYAQKSNDPTIASTYAYALYLQGRSKDGLAAFQKLDAAALKQPSIALYYGVLLSAAGKGNEAAPFLQIARGDGHLLPEEKQLLAETLK